MHPLQLINRSEYEYYDDLPLNQSFCFVMKVDMLLELPSCATASEYDFSMTLALPLVVMLDLPDSELIN